MSFCREYCLLAVFGVRVRFWLFRGLAACFTVVCLFYAAVCALCAWFRWFTSFICHILSLSGGRRLCVCCVRRFLRFVRLFLTAVCVFQRFCVNWCFSYCLLSFACLDGLFYLICLSLPLITHFLYFFDVFLYALRVACLFFALLAGFCTAWRLVLRNMSFFTVDCSFFCTL